MWYLVFLDGELVWKVRAKSEQVADIRFRDTFIATMMHDPVRWRDKTVQIFSEDEYEELRRQQLN